jgi:hypothetical protein
MTTPQLAPSTSSTKQFQYQVQATQDYMQTRSKSGIFVPERHFSLSASAYISPLPSTCCSALKDPNWFHTMREEYNALMDQNTWTLVTKLAGANVVMVKWIFRHKNNSGGSLARYKATLTMKRPSTL